MKMYPSLELYKHYLKHSCAGKSLPDLTHKLTMNRINQATNLCDIRNNFIDIGAGNGYNAIALSHIFNKGTIVEVEMEAQNKERASKFNNVTIFGDLIEKYDSGEEKFDFVLLADIFEHIPDINSFIDKIAKIQTENGVVYMMTPNPIFCGPAPESNLSVIYKHQGHIKHYTSQEIINIMKKRGYELIFHFYEESHLRREMKNVLKGIERRDNRWRTRPLYKIFRPILMPFILLFFKTVEYFVHKNEIKNSRNPFSTITQDLAFKKIK